MNQANQLQGFVIAFGEGKIYNAMKHLNDIIKLKNYGDI